MGHFGKVSQNQKSFNLGRYFYLNLPDLKNYLFWSHRTDSKGKTILPLNNAYFAILSQNQKYPEKYLQFGRIKLIYLQLPVASQRLVGFKSLKWAIESCEKIKTNCQLIEFGMNTIIWTSVLHANSFIDFYKINQKHSSKFPLSMIFIFHGCLLSY